MCEKHFDQCLASTAQHQLLTAYDQANVVQSEIIVLGGALKGGDECLVL